MVLSASRYGEELGCWGHAFPHCPDTVLSCRLLTDCSLVMDSPPVVTEAQTGVQPPAGPAGLGLHAAVRCVPAVRHLPQSGGACRGPLRTLWLQQIQARRQLLQPLGCAQANPCPSSPTGFTLPWSNTAVRAAAAATVVQQQGQQCGKQQAMSGQIQQQIQPDQQGHQRGPSLSQQIQQIKRGSSQQQDLAVGL